VTTIPERPRLGDHVRARRHVVGAESRIVLHVDDRSLVLGEREWTVLQQADGTRDLEGMRQAAAQHGVRVGLEHVRAFVTTLARQGFFEDPRASEEPARTACPRPLRALEGYHFRCSGRGQCCSQYDTVLLTPLEVARARVALPLVREAGMEPDRAFLPEQGLRSFLSVPTRVDGACMYHDTHAGCRLHTVAGAHTKPHGCRTFPAALLDVGDHIRVAPRPECACVFESASLHEGEGEPLLDARHGSELPPEVYVPRLPERITVGSHEVSADELVAWVDALEPRGDRAEYCWRLAAAVAARGLDARDDALPPLDLTGLGRALAEARASVRRLEARLGCGWRHPRDGVRRGLAWVRAALDRVEPLSPAREPDDEAFYVRAALYLVPEDLETQLREHAIALWIARAFPEDARATPEAAHPLAVVEAMARGHGLRLTP
jgi:lysine-N-methylase